MESYAFQYGLEKNYSDIVKRNKTNAPKRIQMKELFNLITGTATQSVLAATLAVPSDNKTNNSYYAQNVIDFFNDYGPQIFRSTSINKGLLWIIVLLNTYLAGFLGFLLGSYWFANS